MNRFYTLGLRGTMTAIVALAGFGVASLVGVALATTFTLQVARNAKVTNQAGMTTTESIAVSSRGLAIYTLSGDSKIHPKCTSGNGCFSFWPPLTVPSPRRLSKGSGISGRLAVWHRDGFFQVTLGGHPLYRFAPDPQRDKATGEGIQSFGGTWHVVKAAASPAASTTVPAGTMTTSATPTGMTPTTTTTTTPTCLYPPC